MIRRSKASVGRTWCWRRWISAGQRDLWTERLETTENLSWALTERPNRSRILLEAYTQQRVVADLLVRRFGGQARPMKALEWMKSTSTSPTRIGRRLEIVHEKSSSERDDAVPRLHIPHGTAFGSGDHATTHLLLRALAGREDWNKTALLDLGTGSGVLALAARRFGAKKIVATDFDPEAVRTARQNEMLNFSKPLIRWQRADVKRLRAAARYDLVVANLFSGILCEAAPSIAGCLSVNGQLWMSGILRAQQEQVIAAYRRRGLQLVRAVSRGKWMMLQWQKSGLLQVTVGAATKTAQTK